MKQPQRLTLQNMFDTLVERNMFPDKYYFKDGLAIAIDINGLFKPFIDHDSPFLIDDYRLGVVKRGSMRSCINLQMCDFGAGSLIYVTPGSIVEPVDMSDDFQVMGIGIPSDMFHIVHSGRLPELFNGHNKHCMRKINDEEFQLLNHMFLLLWEIAHAQESHAGESAAAGQAEQYRGVLHQMLATITHYYDALFALQPKTACGHHSANDILDRFLRLVNRHCAEERRLAFYAGKICVTERYLGTVVRQTSGITAKEWIDKAVITAAKVKLRHSNLQIAEITEALHFPNPSFFCKYFKRLTGFTPQEYRDKG